VQTRLEDLKKELETGQAELQQVDRQRAYLRETILRISGAIQVLEEMLAEQQSSEHNAAGPVETQPAAAQTNEADVRQPDVQLGKG